jgi:putative NIF3 family GTP cyclohydrolase 1 type 2
MKVNDIVAYLNDFSKKPIENTCDGIKSGRADRDLKKVAVAMFATPAVIKNAHDWGAEMLIVHEPTYYNHFDVHTDDPLEVEKRKLLEESGITVYRFHDVPHYSARDMIAEGMLETLGLKGKTVFTDTFDLVRLELSGEYAPELWKDTDALLRRFADRFYHFEVKDSSKIRIDPESYKNDKSFKGEFIRSVSADDSLDEDTKAKIIACGLYALMGENIYDA